MPSADLPTFRQVIQFFYFTVNNNQNISKQNLLEEVENSLSTLWNKVKPRLPLLQRNSILRKLRNLFERVKSINRGRCKSKSKEYQDLILDKLFDISACTCELATVLCNDRDVKCSIINCQVEHILCLYKTRKVNDSEEEYNPVKSSQYNLMKLDRFAMEAVRYIKFLYILSLDKNFLYILY
nr:uncharacterized protein LOC124805975 [Hydra vulgaris]